MTGPDVGRMLRLSAQSDADEQVHAVELAAGELVDPSRLQTRCGVAVFEVYNDHRPITCAICAGNR